MDPIFLAVLGILAPFLVFALSHLAKASASLQAEGQQQLTDAARPKLLAPRGFTTPEGEILVSWQTGLGDPHQEYMEAILSLSTWLPSLELRSKSSILQGPSFEGHFVLRRQLPGASLLLEDPQLRRLLLAIAQRRDTWSGTVSFFIRSAPAGCRVVLYKEGLLSTETEVEQLAEQFGAIGQAAIRCWDGPWLRVAERWALGTIQRDEQGLRTLAGPVGGVELQLHEITYRGGPETLLVLTMPSLERFPSLRVAHRDDARKQGWGEHCGPTGNPVLDMCVAVRGAHLPAVRALLDDASLTELLLPVIHGRQGELLGEELHVPCGELPGDQLPKLIAEALELGEALEAKAAQIAGQCAVTSTGCPK